MRSTHVSESPQIGRLVDAVLLVAGDLDLQSVLRRVVDAACALVGARYGALGVIDEDGAALEAFVHVGVDDVTVEKIGPLPSGHGILGLLIDHPTPLRLDDLTSHPQSYGFPAHHPPMHSFLGTPIRVGERVFGNLYLTEKADGGAFSDHDEELVVALAAVAGAAIFNARMFDDVRRRETWHNAMLEVADALLAGVDRRDVHQTVVSRCAELVDADAVCLVVADDKAQPHQLRVEASHGRGPEPGQLVAAHTGAWQVLQGADRVRRESGEIFARPSLWIPIRDGKKVVAALGMARQRAFSPREEDFVVGFAEQVSLAWTFDLAQRQLRRLSLIEDRERIGRDLHDTVIQRLFATGLSLQAIVRRLDDQPELADRLHRAVDEIDLTVKEIRSTIFALQDAQRTAPTGVRRRLLEVVDEIGTLLDATPRVRFHGPIDSVTGAAVAEELIPVVREALTNVAKHAQASDVEVDVVAAHGRLTLQVIDDGFGVDSSAAQGFGLDNLRERAQRLGGICRLESRPNGKGAMLTWEVPSG
ncbi:MAG: GAF domain-containing protein [Nitriliruptoraceae bacterium]